MKKIVLINSYCDTEHKINILNKNIDILKSIDVDIMLYSPIILPEYIIEKCNYFLFNKENKVLHFPQKGVRAFYKFIDGNKSYIIRKMLMDYGWASIYQFKKMSEYALTMDYSNFYHIIYDTILDEQVKDYIISSDKESGFFKFHSFTVSLHFMIFNRENLLKFLPNVTLENYLSNTSYIAETWLHNNLLQTFGDRYFENVFVEDEVFFYESEDQFNYSKIPNLKFFILKDYYKVQNIKLFFYDLKNAMDLSISVNGVQSNHTSINNYDIIDLNIKDINSESEHIIITHNNKSFNIEDEIIGIINNSLEIFIQ
jgi:hypothetical protein